MRVPASKTVFLSCLRIAGVALVATLGFAVYISLNEQTEELWPEWEQLRQRHPEREL
jgi:hypothetical protein